MASVFNNPSTRLDTRKMLRISLLCLLTIGLPQGDAVTRCVLFISCLILTNFQHAFKRLTSYGKYGNFGGDYTKMLGELFFKQGEGERKENDLSLVDEDIENLPYEVLKTYEVK